MAAHYPAIPVRCEFSLFDILIRKQLFVCVDVGRVDYIVKVMRGILPNVTSFCKRRISQEGTGNVSEVASLMRTR